jgi:cell division protein FtsW (lipid II flippase)
MALLQRMRMRDVPWGPLLLALALTATGIAFVVSACWDPGHRWGLGREAQLQLAWWLVGLAACAAAAHVPMPTWRVLAYPAYALGLAVQLAMLALQGTPLVPAIKGQHNWLALGPLRVQPSEFIKLAVLLACARVVTMPGFDARRFAHVLGALAVAGIPAALIAKEDLGSALTFPAMIVGMLVLVGMRLGHLAALALALVLAAGVGIARLPREGPDAYKYQRLQAFLHPEQYASMEAYQTIRSIRSIGSGQVTGKGYAAGDQNRLGWLPEKHTDMIFAVVGEEVGFVGSASVLCGFLLFAWSGMLAATQARDPFGRALATGFVCLVMGQASINLAVALGLMPVTGITLPFFSYGGSSLLGTYIGLGMLLATGGASRAPSGSLSRGW